MATTPTTGVVNQEEWWKSPTDTASTTAPTGLIGTPRSYTPETATTPAGTWTPTADQTVAGNVDQIIAADSPLMQRAATRADQQMNKRGLINSSMAIGAGQTAVMDAALPIAQQDAQTRAQAAQYGAQSKNQLQLAGQEATNRAAEYGANAQNTLQAQSNTIRQQAAQLNADAANKLYAQELDVAFKERISNADIASKTALQQMADATKVDLANIQATYQQMISSNDQAGALYGKVMQNITDIVNNPDIAAADKTTAIENQKTMLRTGMDVVSAVSGLQLGSILNFA